MQRTIRVLNTPDEGATLDVNTGMFVFSDQMINTSDRVQISREEDIPSNIAAKVNQRPIGCTAEADKDVVTLTSDGPITIVCDSPMLEVSE